MTSRPNRSKLALVVLFFCALRVAAPGGNLNQEEKDPLHDQVDKVFAQWDKPDSPGCEVAVVKDGQIVYKRGYGMANLEHNIKMSPSSIMDTGSVSKQFTAMSIALLAEQGKIALDDEVRKYIREIPQYEAPVTIRQLIHHTSGIRDYLTLMSIAGMRNDDHYVDGEVISLLARQKELNFKPGSEYLYSNSGYFLLSEIVKRASGKTLRQFAEENIFKPLGMTRTMFYDDHNEIVKNRAASYVPRRSGGFQIAATTLDMVGDGNVFTCVEDLFLWDQNFYHNKLGKGGPELINQVLTRGTLNNGTKIDYAFGLVIGEYRGLRIVEHGGAFVGYRAMTMRFPDQRFSVVIQCNLGTMNPSNLARRIADIYLADHFKSETVTARAPETKFIELPAGELNEKTGAYRTQVSGLIWKLSVKDGQLIAQLPNNTVRFGAVSSTEFRSIGAPIEFTLRFEKQGKAMTLSVQRGADQPINFEPVTLVKPTAEQLAEYPGAYRSDEVQVTYKIVLEDGRLYLRHENEFKSVPRNPLEPTTSDSFVVQGIVIQFTRDARKRVSAFTFNAGRVKNIKFVKNG